MPAAIPDGKILIIDDDEGILSTVKILLRRQFGLVQTANTPQKITQLLHQDSYHVVLLDMNFSPGDTSGEDGFFWLEQINQSSPGSSVILMTAYGEIDLAIRALKQGAVDFVVKPWENDKLQETLLAAYKKSQFSEPARTEIPETSPHAEVERIFMFLDLKGSTSMAESLGHVKYFSLLSDFFSDIADPISSRDGNIYQYVGDEAVVVWDLESGLANVNCLNCFFEIKSAIQNRADHYQERFGLIPEFKAGLHAGKVTTGWIGKHKKEIVYSGDVLNTTSRIEGLCNKHNRNLLISGSLLSQLHLEKDQFHATEVGLVPLRGRKEPMKLYSISQPDLVW